MSDYCDPRDFAGHIGCDDLIILLQNEDWEERCRTILNLFAAAVPDFYNEADRKNAGYISEDRRGKKVFHALVTISLELVKIEPGHYVSHHQIASAMADAKKQAKKILGNSLFIDRRQEPWLNEKTEDDTAQLELMTH